MFKKLIFTIVCTVATFTVTPLQAQEQASLADRAYQFYLAGEYAKAAEMYSRVQDKKALTVKEMEVVADAYFQVNEYALAEQWLERLNAHDASKAESVLNYAHVLKINGKYADAKASYTLYGQRFPAEKDVSIFIAGCDSAILWMAKPTTHHIQNEAALNTSLAEFGVLPLSNGILYTAEPALTSVKISGMTGKAYSKIFSASRDDDGVTLKYPVLMDAIFNQASYHVGPVASNEQQDVLYVTRTYMGNGAEKVKRDGMRFKKYNLELIIYKKQGDSWLAEPFPYNNVEQYSLGHATLSTDGRLLYYASDMPGGRGGIDIWYSELQSDGTWGKPQNAGQEINAAGDELFPSVFADSLYFSSNSYAGMGGLDIFKVIGQKADFRSRENLKYPVNSSADDFAFVVSADDEDQQYGYISSNRSGGAGYDDIYSFIYTKPNDAKVYLKAKIYDKASASLAGAQVKLYDAAGVLLSKIAVDGTDFQQVLERRTAYKVVVSREGFMSDSLLVPALNIKRDTTLMVNFYLQPVNKKGISFVLENIYYDFGKDVIRKDAALVLDQIVHVMNENPTLQIELSSHTDSRGADKYNLKLSERRAKSAVDYIISKGISRERLQAKGYGETKLVNRCGNGVDCTEDEHQANRRTEVKVLSF